MLKAWNTLDKEEQEIYLKSSLAGVKIIFELEPLLTKEKTKVNLEVQVDYKGKESDVRDIITKSYDYEIGLSIKHNHFAVKHSRLSKTLD